tara:strand:+ start:10013 stop:11287 length:1275 start_codon:yes stop_codon:yes gene_type:complete
MSGDLHQQAELIFNEAIERPEPSRGLYLEEACRGDDELREEVDALIVHYETAEGMLNQPLSGTHEITTGPDDSLNLSIASEGPGTLIGSYRILQSIEESDHGAIYLVQQDEPPRRLCLDIYAPTSRSDERSRRFQHLRDRIAVLEHPGVVQLVETGTAHTGKGMQHFVVAEYVEGTPLLESLRRTPRSMDEKIELIVEIADILSHAHRRGVVHGDLRPGTVLVDTSGLPRVLDFAVARTIGLPRSIVGTHGGTQGFAASMFKDPAVDQDAPHIDIRSDVFSLGMIACLLLWGRLPWQCDEDTPEATRRAMLATRPAPPSNSELGADMDSVLLKAIKLDPELRYGSTHEFERDLVRAKAGEPVEARAPDLMTDARALAGRHPAATAIALVAALIVLITCFVLGTSLTGDQPSSPPAQGDAPATQG